MDHPSPHSPDEDRIWIEKAKKDIRFFEPIYQKYFATIYRYIYRRTEDDELAADLCSGTFCTAMLQLKKFEWQGKPIVAWLYRIAQNEVNKHFRSKKRVFIIEEDKLMVIPDFERHWNKINVQLLYGELARLEEADLQVIELRFFEGMSFAEIANVMEMGESAVKMKLYRLLNKLKANLEVKHARI